MKEEWRKIRGYENHYEVSNLGRVRTITRKVRAGFGSFRTIKGKVLKENCPEKDKYIQVMLIKDGVRSYPLVHRLVLEAFVGPCAEGMECRHFPDRSRSNNVLTNLSWATKIENHKDKKVHGTELKGEKNHASVLTRKAVTKIRRRYRKGGATLKQLAKEYKVHLSTIWAVVQNRTWV